MRVSIVATALDGDKPGNTVLNMVSRIQNRNTGYSEGLFSQQTKIDTNTFGSIDGATALKLDEKYEVKEQEEEAILNTKEFNVPHFADNSIQSETIDENIPDGVSIENASYIETQSENILSKENENLETNLETNNAVGSNPN